MSDDTLDELGTDNPIRSGPEDMEGPVEMPLTSMGRDKLIERIKALEGIVNSDGDWKTQATQELAKAQKEIVRLNAELGKQHADCEHLAEAAGLAADNIQLQEQLDSRKEHYDQMTLEKNQKIRGQRQQIKELCESNAKLQRELNDACERINACTCVAEEDVRPRGERN